LETLTANPQINISAVGSPQVELAERLAQTLRIQNRFTRFDALLTDPAVTHLLLIASPESQRDYCILASKAGKQVLLQGPTLITPSDCTFIVEAARSANVSISFCDNNQFYEPLQRALGWLKNGAIGTAVAYRCRLVGTTPYLNEIIAGNAQQETAPSTIIRSWVQYRLLTALTLLINLFDKPISVFAQEGGCFEFEQLPTAFTLQHEANLIGIIETVWQPNVPSAPPHEEMGLDLELIGTTGAIRFRSPLITAGCLTPAALYQAGQQILIPCTLTAWRESYLQSIRKFMAAKTQQHKAGLDLTAIAQALTVIEAARQAVKAKRAIPVVASLNPEQER